jgi:hypothetical protein
MTLNLNVTGVEPTFVRLQPTLPAPSTAGGLTLNAGEISTAELPELPLDATSRSTLVASCFDGRDQSIQCCIDPIKSFRDPAFGRDGRG